MALEPAILWSEPLTEGEEYTALVRVWRGSDAPRVQIAAGNALSDVVTALDDWVTVRLHFTASADSNLYAYALDEIVGVVHFDHVAIIEGTYVGAWFDGSSTPPWSSWDGTPDDSTSTIIDRVLDLNIQPLGYYVTTDGLTYLVVVVDDGTYLFDLITREWTEIWDHPAAGFVQYLNKVVLISEEVTGGYWEDGTWTDTDTMPLGSQIVFYQERFWAFGARGTDNANRVWFSNLTVISPPSTIFDWSTDEDFFEVSTGDGQYITALRADSTALFIFRNASTWQFTFPTSPLSGTLRRLSATTGADNKWCVERYEGYYFVMNQGYLWQFINTQFYPLNTRKIDFQRRVFDNELTVDLRVSMLGSRVIVWYLGNTYVFNAVTSTWSVWDSPATRAAHFLQAPANPADGDSRFAYAITGESDIEKMVLYRIQEDPLQTGAGEPMTHVLRTKSYGFERPAEHKRQTFWTVEVASATGVVGYLYPRSLPSQTTWDEMALTTWDVLAQGNWDNPLVVPSAIASPVDFPLQVPTRILVRLVRDLRFLRMLYEIRGESDGTIRTAPFRIFSIEPYLSLKAKTPRQVN